MEEEAAKKQPKKHKKLRLIMRIIGYVVLFGLLAGLTVNALLCVFVDHYYPTFGNSRLFAIVSDSMEPEIPTGSMIVGRVPNSEADIEVGTVITFEVKQGNSVILVTHRVVEIRTNAAGVVSYTTRGDNTQANDSVNPTFEDVVGIYTGNRCGVFGYIFGFLQSTQGAIALIIIALIVAATFIIVHFVNLVTMWRSIALSALKKSGNILTETQVEQLGVIADVIGIVSKEPLDKQDILRKDKKLKWFIKTGRLPRRPYNNDFDENAVSENEELPPLRLVEAEPSVSAETAEIGEETAVAAEEEGGGTFKDRSEKMTYRFSLLAKIIRLDNPSKERYSTIKNELLSYFKVRVRMGGKYEVFSLGRKTVARIGVRGKTLCLYLAGDPEKYEGSKFAVERVNSNTPCLYRIKSALRAKYACLLIGELMRELGATKNESYLAEDYFLPYEDVVSLMEKGLVKRNISSTEREYKIVEVTADGAPQDSE